MSRRTDLSIARACMIAALLWAGALPLCAYAAGRSPEASGTRMASALVYAVGAVVCHQRPERSFFFWGRGWPVCARCSGIYIGAAVVSLAGLSARRRLGSGPSVSTTRALLGAAALPSLVTLVIEWSGGAPVGNATRFLAGLPLGAAIIAAIVWTATPVFNPPEAVR